jgi:hypothetical protein
MFEWKQLFGIAAIITSIGVTIRSFQPANAHMGGSISYGQNPYKAFYGEAVQGTTTLLTTTSETFIITGINANDGTSLSRQIDGITVVPGNILDEKGTYHTSQGSTSASFNWAYARDNLFLSGNAHVPVEPGSTLDVQCDDSSGCFYYVQGYFAH